MVQDVSQCDAQEADSEPGEDREIINGVCPDVGLMKAGRELEDVWVFHCRKHTEEQPCCDHDYGDEDVCFFVSEQRHAKDDAAADTMEHPKHDRFVRETHGGKESKQHPEIENPESSLERPNVYFAWLVFVSVVVDRLADADKKKEDDRDDDVERIEIFVQGENTEVIKVPEQMQNDHEEDCKSSEDIQLDESLRFFL